MELGGKFGVLAGQVLDGLVVRRAAWFGKVVKRLADGLQVCACLASINLQGKDEWIRSAYIAHFLLALF